MAKIIVTSYKNPDLDGSACALAYAELLQTTGKRVQAMLFGQPHSEAQFVYKLLDLKIPLNNKRSAYQGKSVVLVDVSDLEGLQGWVQPEQVIEVIDHRLVHEANIFKNAKVQIEQVGACATLVYERFVHAGHPPTNKSSGLLQGAIISNTLNFRSESVTERDINAAKRLEKITKIDSSKLAHELFTAKTSYIQKNLQETLVGDCKVVALPSGRLAIAQLEMNDAHEFFIKNKKQISKYLELVKVVRKADTIILNLILLNDNKSYIYAPNPEWHEFLEKALGYIFNKQVISTGRYLLRKELVYKLKQVS